MLKLLLGYTAVFLWIYRQTSRSINMRGLNLIHIPVLDR